ncbi:hypothetical protein HY412_02630 [Candidatus Kaiserbacteria bacterium]|nr:hypothetical protein [Candidatus Kaiserbacteria bacterium]
MKDFKALTKMLIQGSDEVNRMKREIKIVTDLITGLIRPGDFVASSQRCDVLWYYGGKERRGSMWYDSTTDGQWAINLSDKDRVKFFSHNLRAFNELPTSKLLYSSSDGVRLEDVEAVYAALPAFVQAVAEIVPDMWNRIRPYERAAKHADFQNTR